MDPCQVPPCFELLPSTLKKNCFTHRADLCGKFPNSLRLQPLSCGELLSTAMMFVPSFSTMMKFSFGPAGLWPTRKKVSLQSRFPQEKRSRQSYHANTTTRPFLSVLLATLEGIRQSDDASHSLSHGSHAVGGLQRLRAGRACSLATLSVCDFVHMTSTQATCRSSPVAQCFSFASHSTPMKSSRKKTALVKNLARYVGVGLLASGAQSQGASARPRVFIFVFFFHFRFFSGTRAGHHQVHGAQQQDTEFEHTPTLEEIFARTASHARHGHEHGTRFPGCACVVPPTSHRPVFAILPIDHWHHLRGPQECVAHVFLRETRIAAL